MRTTNFLVPLPMMATLIPNTAQAQTERPWSVSFDAGLATRRDWRRTRRRFRHGADAANIGHREELQRRLRQRLHWAAGLGYRLGSHGGELRVGRQLHQQGVDEPAGRHGGEPCRLREVRRQQDLRDGLRYRQYWSDGAIKPFVGASVGFCPRRCDQCDADSAGRQRHVVEHRFYDSSTVPTFGFAAGGVQYHLTDSLAAQVGGTCAGRTTSAEGRTGGNRTRPSMTKAVAGWPQSRLVSLAILRRDSQTGASECRGPGSHRGCLSWRGDSEHGGRLDSRGARFVIPDPFFDLSVPVRDPQECPARIAARISTLQS